MMQRFVSALPYWMHPGNPILRYALGAERRRELPARERYLRVFISAVLLFLLLAGGYVAARNLLQEDPLRLPLSQMLNTVLFWPVFMLQIVLQVLVLALTINTIGEERRRQTWDSVRATASGPALTLRARWSAAIFYRARGFLTVVMLARVVLIGAILFDLTSLSGEYLSLLLGNITPQLPVPVGVLLLAAAMTGVLLLPFTSLGMDAAAGLLVSTLFRERAYIVLAQITLVAGKLLMVGVLLFFVTQFQVGTINASDQVIWLLLLAFALFGDWGLGLLYLGYFGAEVWANVPYGIFIGLAILVFVLMQAALTDAIISWAIRRAETHD